MEPFEMQSNILDPFEMILGARKARSALIPPMPALLMKTENALAITQNGAK
jgi:hypothetical protein